MVLVVQVLVVLSVTLAAAEGQTFHLGSCPRPSVQENLNVSQVKHVFSRRINQINHRCLRLTPNFPQTNSSPVPVSSTWESGMRSKSFQQHLKEESASRRRTLSSVMERSTSTTLRFCKDFYCRKCSCSLLFLQQLIISFGLWFYEPCSVFFVCLFCSQL